MFVAIIFSLLLTICANPWDGYHRQIDDELPSISWKECGISVRNCDPNSTFKDPFVSSRIVNGEFANNGEYPWFVHVQNYYTKQVNGRSQLQSESCGGAIINEWWVLTASHCFDHIENNQSLEIQIGSTIYSGGRRLDVQKGYIQPIYYSILKKMSDQKQKEDKLREEIINIEVNDIPINDSNSFEQMRERLEELHWNWSRLSNDRLFYDIGLIKLKTRIVPVFNSTHYSINSICLPKTGIINKNDESLVIIGMGATTISNEKRPSQRLKKGLTRMHVPEFCRQLVGEESYYPMICTTRHNITDKLTPMAHSGDSGSPCHQYLNCKAILLGEDSFGETDVLYTYFVRVSLFMPWIRSTILSENKMICGTNHLLIVSVITTAIIAVFICCALLWSNS